MLRLKIPSNLENIEDFLGISLISLQNCWTTCSTSVPISLCRHPAGIHSANCDPEISKCAWPTSKFSVFTHITSKPLLTRGVLGPHIRIVCSRPSVLEFAPSRDTPHSYLIFSTGGSSSPCSSGSAAHSRPRNSWQFFSLERLSPRTSNVKSTHVFGRVTAHQNHTASLKCP